MYAIINIKTKKFVYGTDYRHFRRVDSEFPKSFNQRTSTDRALTYDSEEAAKSDMLIRGMGKDYRIVRIQLSIVGEVNG